MGYRYQQETVNAAVKLGTDSVSAHAHALGIREHEPLLVAMDAMLRYAKAYTHHFDGTLSDDYVLGPYYLSAIKGIRDLLCGDGAVALERDISTDSKDNGAIEAVFWQAMRVAGFQESDL